MKVILISILMLLCLFAASNISAAAEQAHKTVFDRVDHSHIGLKGKEKTHPNRAKPRRHRSIGTSNGMKMMNEYPTTPRF